MSYSFPKSDIFPYIYIYNYKKNRKKQKIPQTKSNKLLNSIRFLKLLHKFLTIFTMPISLIHIILIINTLTMKPFFLTIIILTTNHLTITTTNTITIFWINIIVKKLLLFYDCFYHILDWFLFFLCC
jgi:hypothetical protein